MFLDVYKRQGLYSAGRFFESSEYLGVDGFYALFCLGYISGDDRNYGGRKMVSTPMEVWTSEDISFCLFGIGFVFDVQGFFFYYSFTA